MLRSAKVLLSLLLAGCCLLSGCSLFGQSSSSKGDDSEPEKVSSGSSSNSTPGATVPATEYYAATADTPEPVDDSTITYNSYEIKRNIDEIDETLDNILDYHKYCGALYVKFGNDYETNRERGTANTGAHIKNSIHTSVYAGELTRLVTAIAVLQLSEEKELNLKTTKLDRYFPNCPYAKDVTVDQLLTMTSGIPDYVQETKGSLKEPVAAIAGKLKENDAVGNRNTILNWILSQQRTASAAAYSPSNSNYYLLGEIIAKESGESCEDYIKTHVFLPIYMTKSGFAADESTARPYTGNENSAKMLYPGVGSSALGLVTNVSDLLRLVDSMMYNNLISQQEFQTLFTDYGNGYGYGAEVHGIRVTCIGSLDAYKTKLSFTTNNNQIFIALSNDINSSPDEIHRLLRDYLSKFRN